MTYIIKAIKYVFWDSLRYVAFLFFLTAFIVLLMTLIAYPVQTIAFILIGGAACLLFGFFDTVGR